MYICSERDKDNSDSHFLHISITQIVLQGHRGRVLPSVYQPRMLSHVLPCTEHSSRRESCGPKCDQDASFMGSLNALPGLRGCYAHFLAELQED